MIVQTCLLMLSLQKAAIAMSARSFAQHGVPVLPPIFPDSWQLPTPGWFQPLNTSAVLTHMNALRAAHSAPPVVMDPTLTAFAQTWANYLGGSRLFFHSGVTAYGETLNVVLQAVRGKRSDSRPPSGGGFPSTAAVMASIDRWYAESTLYNQSSPGFSDATGHFTQLVWQGSGSVGVGYAVWGDASQEQTVVTMNFWPPGNILSTSAFRNNVM